MLSANVCVLGGVTIGAGEINRIVRRDSIELIARWKLCRFPEGLDPTTTDDPFAAFAFRDALFHLCQEIFERVNALEIQFHLALADSKNVTMRIGKTRSYSFAAKVNDARFVVPEFLRLSV